MMRGALYATALLVALTGTVAVAQRVTTVDELDTTMKRVGPAQARMNKAIQSMAFADARQNIPVIRQALLDAENFWVIKKKDDAVKGTKAAVAKLDALDKVLGSSPTADAATLAFKELGATCRDCHMTYREQDGDDYRLKPGTVD